MAAGRVLGAVTQSVHPPRWSYVHARGSLTVRELGESAAGALHPASCHNIIRDLEKLDGVQRGAASTIKGLGGIKGLIYEER